MAVASSGDNSGAPCHRRAALGRPSTGCRAPKPALLASPGPHLRDMPASADYDAVRHYVDRSILIAEAIERPAGPGDGPAAGRGFRFMSLGAPITAAAHSTGPRPTSPASSACADALAGLADQPGDGRVQPRSRRGPQPSAGRRWRRPAGAGRGTSIDMATCNHLLCPVDGRAGWPRRRTCTPSPLDNVHDPVRASAHHGDRALAGRRPGPAADRTTTPASSLIRDRH